MRISPQAPQIARRTRLQAGQACWPLHAKTAQRNESGGNRDPPTLPQKAAWPPYRSGLPPPRGQSLMRGSSPLTRSLYPTPCLGGTRELSPARLPPSPPLRNHDALPAAAHGAGYTRFSTTKPRLPSSRTMLDPTCSNLQAMVTKQRPLCWRSTAPYGGLPRSPRGLRRRPWAPNSPEMRGPNREGNLPTPAPTSYRACVHSARSPGVPPPPGTTCPEAGSPTQSRRRAPLSSPGLVSSTPWRRDTAKGCTAAVLPAPLPCGLRHWRQRLEMHGSGRPKNSVHSEDCVCGPLPRILGRQDLNTHVDARATRMCASVDACARHAR